MLCFHHAGAAESSGYGGGESEDMLQMALRMATSMPGAPGAMDLESQLQATPVNPSACPSAVIIAFESKLRVFFTKIHSSAQNTY